MMGRDAHPAEDDFEHGLQDMQGPDGPMVGARLFIFLHQTGARPFLSMVLCCTRLPDVRYHACVLLSLHAACKSQHHRHLND